MTEPVDPPSERPPGFLRRNWVSVVACSVAVVSLAVAVGALASDSGGSTPAAAVPNASAASATSPAAKGAGPARRAVRATIESESGATWTVQTAKGQTITVTITPQTQFGTPKAAADESDFAVGSNVVITGTVTNGAATATRVAAQKASAATTPSASSAPSSGSTPS